MVGNVVCARSSYYEFIGLNKIGWPKKEITRFPWITSFVLCAVSCWYESILRNGQNHPNATQITTEIHNTVWNKKRKQHTHTHTDGKRTHSKTKWCYDWIMWRNEPENEIIHKTFVYYKLMNWFCMCVWLQLD